ncbi:hypothetical protein MKW92_009809 [Papaver armeniacum]|nr:hypothetical protein MKW92_009809 [Papaver armeniacum]
MINANKLPEADISGLHRVHFVFGKEYTPFPKELFKIGKLRTFSSAIPKFVDKKYAEQFFSNFRYVRVMDLSDSAISELPPSIAKLKHLRYVNLSNSQLSKLPKSFTTLYNLQTLILKNCSELNDLPHDMAKLINLRHLIIYKTQAGKQMPSMIKGVHKLVNLQYFPVFVVGKDSGFGVEELRDLNRLGGKLHIHNLENVTDRKAAEAGGLREKRHILRLELHWNDTENYDDSVRDDFEVLDGLQPHPNLRKLGIYNYVGSKFPTWMISPNSLLMNLVSISLKNCSTCENLPPLGLLPCLKVLKIDGLDAVKKIGIKFEGCNGKPITSLVERNLSSLKTVKISSCNDIMLLPQRLLNEIYSLHVLECPTFEGFEPNQYREEKQIQLPPNNSLRTLVLCQCPALISWPDVRRFDALSVLVIVDCKSQNSIPFGIDYLPKLEHLVIGGFSDDLDSFPFPTNEERLGTKGSYFPSLRSLSMYGWSKLNCLPDQVQYITSLQFLTVCHFQSLVALPEWLGELASLWELRVTDCENLKHMPSTEQMLRLTSLQEIYICDCSLLEDRCKQGGEEFNKIFGIRVRYDHGF